MTDWPAVWRPVNPQEAQEYLDVHKDGSGDPELIEECKQLIDSRQLPERPMSDVPPVGDQA